MKKSLIILVSILILISGISFLLLNFGLDYQNKKSGVEVTPPVTTPQPIQTPTPPPQAKIPDDWKRFYDSVLDIEIAYPSDWTPRPATNPQGESAIYSFDPAEELGAGTVPTDQLKVGIVYFGADDDRGIGYPEAEIISEEETTVDGYPADRLVVEGLLGRSIDTQVETDKGKYLISAYPAESDLIDIYDQILKYIQLDTEIRVSVNQPELGATISSPVTVTGQAPGGWFFEAVLPISVETVDGEVLAEEIFVTDQNWMTEEAVDFSLEIEFDSTDANLGFIKIIKNDVSEIPRNQHFFYWPIGF